MPWSLWARRALGTPQPSTLIGAWFLAREVELPCARAALVPVKDGVRPSVTLYLPATENDLTALGVARSLFCICQAGPRKDCLACGARTHLGMLRQLFPWAVEGSSSHKDARSSPSFVVFRA